MNRQFSVTAIVAASLFFFASSAAIAAETVPATPPAAGMSGTGDMSKHHAANMSTKATGGGMEGGKMDGMMGMMGMMNSCRTMMADAKKSDSTLMPTLPPGNEKLEFQMHAEMMQKMGEIAARYGDKIKDAK